MTRSLKLNALPSLRAFYPGYTFRELKPSSLEALLKVLTETDYLVPLTWSVWQPGDPVLAIDRTRPELCKIAFEPAGGDQRWPKQIYEKKAWSVVYQPD